MKTFKTMAVLFLLMFSGGYAYSQGEITPQNGNITFAFQDFGIPGQGYALLLERSFNSMSGYFGKFGHKWGTNFDQHFKVTPEGTVEITSFGGGFKTIFTAKNFTPQTVDQFVDDLWNRLPAASRSEKLKKSLLTDESLRHKLAGEHKLLRDIPFDIELSSTARGPEVLKKIKDTEGKIVWIRSYADGSKEYYDVQGKLTKVEDLNKNFLLYKYNPQGQLMSVTDAVGRRVTFEYNTMGLVSKIIPPAGSPCEYRYSADKDLIYAKNSNGFEFKYAYKKHHLIEVQYVAGGQKEIMKYDDKDRVIYHEGPNKEEKRKVRYDHKGNEDKFLEVTLTTERGSKHNPQINVKKYEFEYARRKDGFKFARKTVTVVDGIRIETVNSECCGKPLSIERQGQITRFEYYEDGSLKSKASPNGKKVEVEYDKSSQKVSKVTQTEAKTKKVDVTEYKYKNGNMVFARNKTLKISLQVDYYKRGQTRSIVDQDGRKFLFEYNEFGLPTRITQVGVGSLVVSYNAKGEMLGMDSPSGRNIAAAVAQAFETVIDIIRPAGIDLNI
ncbi:MAG: RHS repeat protein [Deltaproteobacteria bacterium]|nr:RHS repeat protein [Deltaproteobacteria bacterium]